MNSVCCHGNRCHPERSEGSAVTRSWTALVVILAVASAYCIVFVAPPEAAQGYVQKIFYIHVGSALAMYIGFLCAGIGAVAYLWRRALWADAFAVAGAEVGFVFCTIVLVTGPIWAKPIWGVWWTWDARLTSTFFCWLIFASYHLVRRAIEDPTRARSVSAAVAIIGLFDLPIIHFAVQLWRGAHPSVKATENAMPNDMYLALYTTMATLVLLCGLLIRVRYHLECKRQQQSFTPTQEGSHHA